MVKYAFGFLVVAMVSHIPAKSHMAVNYVTEPLPSHILPTLHITHVSCRTSLLSLTDSLPLFF